MNPALTLLAVLLLPVSSAFAGNWHPLQNNPQMLLEADTPQPDTSEDNDQDKTRKKDKKLKIWSKSTYSRPEQAMPGDFFYASDKSLMEINCTKRTHRLLQKVYYAADSQEIKLVRYGESAKADDIVPDSTEERISDFACTFKPSKTENRTTKSAQPKSAVSAKKPDTKDKSPQIPEVKSKTTAQAKSSTAKPKDVAAKPQR